MIDVKLFSVYLCICAVTVCNGWIFKPDVCSPSPPADIWKKCSTCNVFRPKTVTLVVQNVLREPTFNASVTLKCTRSKTLFYMMQEAAEIDSIFRFTVKYFGSELGFFVEGINGLFGNYTLDQTWWSILDGNDELTPVGVSSYKPRDGETVTFNFTQSAGHT